MDVKKFIERWRDHGYERGESQQFWTDLLRDVFGVPSVSSYIFFEQQIDGKYIDARIPAAKVLIEQKSLGKDLTSAYEQAKAYDDKLPFNRKSRWIVTSDFQSFHVHDMNEPKKPPEIILLKDLEREYYRLQFLIDENYVKIQRELKVSIKAGEIVGKLYDALHAQYINPDSDESLKSLNKLCVRLVFCLYAESTGVFGKHKLFRDYLTDARNIRRDLLDLFAVLNTPPEERDPYLDATLKLFPYVNGGLFDDAIEIPNFTDTIRKLLLEEASSGFNWSDISPTIFGAVFESTLNPATRRSGGMHYTSVENIHKVIDPLFLDDLREEFATCTTKPKLREFQNKLATLKFFDPACGSGNFLTETYLSLRRLENNVLKKLLGQQVRLGEFENPIKVSITQFYGIEINDFAVSVAKTALWISELQMMEETIEIIHQDLDFLPLKSYANIYEDNALRADWNLIAPSVDYIIGNPPFVGTKYQNAQQKSDILAVCRNLKPLDYVTGWFFKAAQYTLNNHTRVAFVATNSITQGEQVAPLWNNLTAHIDFAHRTFRWDSESVFKANVYCVVIGFSAAPNPKPKYIFDGDKKILAQNINGYLMDAPNIHISKRRTPICDAPAMVYGSKLVDGGNLIIESDEYDDFIKREPAARKYIRPYIGAEEFICNKSRYCLWLTDCPPNDLRKMPQVMKRVDKVREFRLQSVKAMTREDAKTAWLFQEIRQPDTDFIFVPQTTGEREYVPIGFMSSNVIANAQSLIIPGANIYHFGVLTSIVHMAWMRVVCGRLGTGYRYSASIVYNNFVWCRPNEKQRQRIEVTAQMILDARAKYPDATLADLYSETTMPAELRKAHRDNDRAVMAAYGFDINMSESEIVAELMRMYSAIAS